MKRWFIYVVIETATGGGAAMAQNDVLVKNDPAWRMAVGAELRRIEEGCASAARAQAETVKVWRVTHLWLGSFTVLSAGVAGSVTLATPRFPVVAGALALVAAMLAAVLSVVGPARREGQAAEAAREFRAVEMLSRQARHVDLSGQTFEAARRTLGELTEQWQRAGTSAIPAPRWAQRRAELGAIPELVDDDGSDVVTVFQRSPKTAGQAP